MKKEPVQLSDDNEEVTKGFLRGELKDFKSQVKRELRTEFRKEFATKQDLRDLEFRLTNRMDKGFSEIRDELRSYIDTFQKLADLVLGAHKNFEVESTSIRQNYNQLEERVTKVEGMVFPAT